MYTKTHLRQEQTFLPNEIIGEIAMTRHVSQSVALFYHPNASINILFPHLL